MTRAVPALHVVLLAAAASCSAVAPLPPPDLQAAPVSVAVGGQTLVLTTYLWRDFQPVSPPDGKPLVAILRVQTLTRTPLTSSFSVDGAWITNGTDVWAPNVVQENIAAPGNAYYEVVARDGPKWGPGVTVDVVVRIREASGTTRLLRVAGQLITRTD